jgi:soluble lytic murein transglycosylase-like protein
MILLARQKASEHGLPPELVCAVVEQESGWNQWSIRFEPAFERRYIHPALPQAPSTEEMAKAVSWGLMQVMGEVARENGFAGPFASLCDPGTGIEIGCKVLAHKLAVNEGNVERALLAWNGGGRPQYAAEVLARVQKYRF